MGNVGERLVETLVGQGVLKAEDLRRALEVQKARGGSLSQILVELGVVDPKRLAATMSQTLQIPAVHVSKMEVDPALGPLIPQQLAFQYQLVPVSRMGQQLTVAMADPLNILALDHLSQLTGLSVTPVIAMHEEIQEALRRLYGGAMAETITTLEVLSEAPSAGQEPVQDLVRLTQEGPIVQLTNAILTEGVTAKASDILVEPFEKRLRIRYRVDGTFREADSLPVAMHAGVVSRIKVMSSLNIAEHRLPQDGRIKFFVGRRAVDFRVSVMPSYYGENVCLRILDKTQVVLDIDRLGFDREPLQALKEAMAHPHGMVLITGPTGSGKTTTMYSLLKLADRPDRNLTTVEDPIEYDLPGVNQVAVRPEIGLTFAAALRSILRQDPNVIMIGEIRDEETADIAVKAAMTGHLVLSTLHTNDAIGAVARLRNMGIQPYLIASSVLLVGAQRLPRRVCPKCRKPVTPSHELVEQLALPVEGKYLKGQGCPACRGTGLAGRVGLLEAVPLTSALRQHIARGASAMTLREAAQAEHIRSLRECAIMKAAAGLIPLEEVARTTVGQQE